jgi:hypothetical protein
MEIRQKSNESLSPIMAQFSLEVIAIIPQSAHKEMEKSVRQSVIDNK